MTTKLNKLVEMEEFCIKINFQRGITLFYFFKVSNLSQSTCNSDHKTTPRLLHINDHGSPAI